MTSCSKRKHIPRRVAVPLLSILAGVGLWGCAGTPVEPAAQAEQRETVADILSQPLDQAEYDQPRRCISNLAYRDFQPLDDDYLVFEGPGGEMWLNEVRGFCPGLRSSSTLAFRQHGLQLCELDQFKVVDWFTWARYQRPPWDWLEGVPCTLGKFQPVNEQQVEALKAALRQ